LIDLDGKTPNIHPSYYWLMFETREMVDISKFTDIRKITFDAFDEIFSSTNHN
jgi:hypothetical protein